MHIKHTIQLILCLLYFSLLTSCSSTTVKNSTKPVAESNTRSASNSNDCAGQASQEAIYQCYINGLRRSINTQIRRDIEDWIQYTAETTVGDPVGGTRLQIELNIQGEVQDIMVLQTSGNPSLDNTVVEAIRSASPFALPEDENMRRRMLKFTWDLVI